MNWVVLGFGDYVLDVERRELRRSGDLVEVEPQVFDLLAYLIEHRTLVVSKDDLLQAVWGGRIVSDSAITSRINAARRAVGDTGATQQVIRTIARKGLRFIAEVQEKRQEAPNHGRDALEATPLAPLDRPSIAVLPFANLSGDPEQEYFADGMVEEIITALSLVRWLFVIARASSFCYKGQSIDVRRVGRELGVRYVLEGSVRKFGGRVRITAQLIATETSAHLWADRFDGSLDDVFDLQDRIASSVAGAIEPTLKAAEILRSSRRPTRDMAAYDYYLRALPCAASPEPDRIREGIALLNRAITYDPDYGQALVQLAHCNYQMDVNGWMQDRELGRREGIQLARRALRAAPDDPEVLANAAFVLGYYGEDLGAALALVDRSVTLNPNYAGGWYWSAVLRNWIGEPERALQQLNLYMRLCPRDRFPWYLLPIGISLFFCKRFDEAAAKLVELTVHLPNYVLAYRFLAATYALGGRLCAAEGVIERLRKITPIVEDDGLRYRCLEHRELYLSGLRLAMGEAN